MLQKRYNIYNIVNERRIGLSKKIRLIGLISGAFIIALGIIALCIFSAKNVGDVKYLESSSVSQSSVDLNWKKVGSADGYNIYRIAGDDCEKVGQVEKNDELKFSVESLEPCTKYDFCIKAYKISGKKIYESKKETTTQACTLPTQQEITAVAQAGRSVLLSWQAVESASGYDIEYSQNEDFSESSQESISDFAQTELQIEDLSVDTDYFFKARTFVDFQNERLYGDWSQTARVTVFDKQDESIDPTKPMVAFTFDDGPSYNGASDRILDTIEKYGIKATFFMIGTNAKANSDNVKRKVALGCQIGNHTYDHKQYGKNVSASSIQKGAEAISNAAGGAKVTCFRSTGGMTTDAMRDECRKEGVPLYHWSLDTEDWKSRDAEKVYDVVMSQIKDGDIVLMHEIYESSAEAFEKIVPELLSQGYQFVTCDELITAKTGAPPEPGTQYKSATVINNNTN